MYNLHNAQPRLGLTDCAKCMLYFSGMCIVNWAGFLYLVMHRLGYLFAFCLLTACFDENFKSCEVKLYSTPIIDIPAFKDSIQLGEEVALVMDFFPQDQNGRVLVLPLDFRLRWEVNFYVSGQNGLSNTDTFIYAIAADKGQIVSNSSKYLSVISDRSGNLQQAQIRFRVNKVGRYSLLFSAPNQQVVLGKWGECNHNVNFVGFEKAQNSGFNNEFGLFSFYVKP